MSKRIYNWNGDSVGGGLFHRIISLENLLAAWYEFKRGKGKKQDVQEFEFNLEDNLFQLHQDLKNKNYRHGAYSSFFVYDPKLRHIHKAAIRDRLLHHAVFRFLYPIFDKKFIYDSYSCRLRKGTHRGVTRLRQFTRKVSTNYRIPAYALKCDIRKFFHSVNHDILLSLIEKEISDSGVLWLIKEILESYKFGLPLGNVTSQLFANIYLNELDQFVKHQLKEKYYIRYCDDFIILNKNKGHLEEIIAQVEEFLRLKLRLELHPDKVVLRKLIQGIDFLGYVVMPHYIVVRPKTKKRIFKRIALKRSQLENGKITEASFNYSIQSYMGILKHCRGFRVGRGIINVLKLSKQVKF